MDKGWQLEVLLEVGGFDVDGSMEMTMIKEHTDVQKHNLGGGDISGEFEGIMAIDAFKEQGEGGGTLRPDGEDIINETQLEANPDGKLSHLCTNS